MAHRRTRAVFGGTLPLYLVRVLATSSLTLLVISTTYLDAFSIEDGWIIAVFFAVIFVHHLASLIKWRFFYGIIDVLLLLVEISGCIAFSIVAKPKSWLPESTITFSVMLFITTASLILVALLRVMGIIRSKLRHLWTPVNVFSSASMAKENLFFRIFGRSMWKLHFVGESPITRCIRGAIGLFFFVLLACFLMLNLIFKPMQETALSPIKEYQASALPIDFADAIELPTWNIAFVLPRLIVNSTRVMPISPDLFFASVNVTPLWPNLEKGVNPPGCKGTSSLTKHRTQYGHEMFAIYLFQCASIYETNGWRLPDVVVSMDFTGLIPMLNYMLGSPQQMNFPMVLGLTNNTDVLLKEETMIRSLIPGVNVVSSVSVGVRENFVHPALAAFGIFQQTSAFYFPRTVDTFPDPSLSPLIPRGENISTLRLWTPYTFGLGKTVLIQDYRENSVLAGLASVGGLWTSLGGIFAIIFGATILRIMYGSKPLALVGIAHAFQKERLRKECLAHYPKIISENENPDDRGLLSLLRAHVIDLHFLDPDSSDEEEDHKHEDFEDRPIDMESQPGTAADVKRLSTESLTQLLPLPPRSIPLSLDNDGEDHELLPVRKHE